MHTSKKELNEENWLIETMKLAIQSYEELPSWAKVSQEYIKKRLSEGCRSYADL